MENIEMMAAGYPIFSGTDGDYVFEIDIQALPSNMVNIGYFLVQPGNRQALDEAIDKIIDTWRNPYESITIDKIALFTNLSPWLAIVLLAKRAKFGNTF